MAFHCFAFVVWHIKAIIKNQFIIDNNWQHIYTFFSLAESLIVFFFFFFLFVCAFAQHRSRAKKKQSCDCCLCFWKQNVCSSIKFMTFKYKTTSNDRRVLIDMFDERFCIESSYFFIFLCGFFSYSFSFSLSHFP